LQLDEFLTHLDGVKKTGPTQYMACCPVKSAHKHGDRAPSLSVGKGNNGSIVFYCQGGCSQESVLQALGLSMKDLFPDGDRPRFDRRQEYRPRPTSREDKGRIAAQYDYTDENGQLLARKTRWEKTVDGKRKKTFTWGHPAGQGFQSGRNGMAVPYRLPGLVKAETVFLCEGEKDVDNLTAQGLAATCTPDGAGTGSKWRDTYTPYFAGKTVYILQDNDEVGKKFAQYEAQKLSPVAQEVKVLDLTALWPQLPEHGDISDVMEHLGATQALADLLELADKAPGWEPPPPEKSPFLSSFHTLSDFTEEEPSWLVEGWIPEGQITLLAADGGTGKTTLWCNLVAALSSGRPCLLDSPDVKREPLKVAFFSTEDSVKKKLKRQLRQAGANEDNILTTDFSSGGGDALRELKLGSDRLREVIANFRPALCVFDPIQGFLPSRVNMGSRNEMRDCMAPLIALGEEFGTAFFIVCHTNKRMGASDRSRLADSADLWDVARSVLMMGYTGEPGQRYLSHEKNNYADRQETLLLSFGEGGQLVKEGTTWKRDREFMQEAVTQRSAPQREECKAFLLEKLGERGNSMASKELENLAKAAGYSRATIRRAKDELKDSSAIVYKNTGNGNNKVWTVQRTEFSEPETYMTIET
jgi:RecA-family ATPase/5S rRNA maturation endonuclease (ribonuclease M5)